MVDNNTPPGQMPTKTLYWIKLIAALIAILTFFGDYVVQRIENRILLRERVRIEEKNKELHSVLVNLVSKGNVTMLEISPFISDVEARDIANKVVKTTNVSLPFGIEDRFHPSGWMGDGELGTQYINFRHVSSTTEGTISLKNTIRIEYNQGPKGFAGIYWQYPDGNWGEKPGLNLVGAKRISFYVKGERGGEIVEFKAGGISSGKYRDSFMKSTGKVTLSSNWRKYEIDLSKEDLSSVIGGFAWVAAGSDNQGHLITYISNLTIE